jgi:transcriptional regulator with XRE-family HTH domain
VIDVEVWTGLEAHRLRAALRMSQRQFAAHLGVSERTVAKWDSRGTETRPRGEFQRVLDTALAQAPADAQNRFRVLQGGRGSGVPHGLSADVRASLPSSAKDSPIAGPEPGLSEARVEQQPQLTTEEDMFAGRPVDLAGTDRAAMESFRAADPKVGGGVLYASVLSYLRNGVGPRLRGSDAADGGQQTAFRSAAALTEMAGWMAHDAGRDRSAEAHLWQSLTLAVVSGDQQLAAHVYGSLSHLANHAGRSEEAIALARRGLITMNEASANPDVQAPAIRHGGTRARRTA